MGSQNLVNFASDDGLLFDGAKPLSEPILTKHLCVLWYSHEGKFTEIFYPGYEFENDLFKKSRSCV